MMPRAFSIHPKDSVAVLLDDAEPGPVKLLGLPGDPVITASQPIMIGHKIALSAHEAGAAVTKFGVRIGHATASIAPGDWVHLHNCASDLDERSNSLEVTTGTPTDTIYE